MRDGRTVRFRVPRWEDRAAFAALLNELHAEAQQTPLWVPTRAYDAPAAADKLFQALKNIEFGRGIHLFVDVHGDLLGHGWVNYGSGMFGNGYGTLGLELVERGRGGGIGKRLIEVLAERARDAGMQAVQLTVSSENPAMQLYKSLGYEEVGRKKHYVGAIARDVPFEERADLVDMVKWLRPPE